MSEKKIEEQQENNIESDQQEVIEFVKTLMNDENMGWIMGQLSEDDRDMLRKRMENRFGKVWPLREHMQTVMSDPEKVKYIFKNMEGILNNNSGENSSNSNE